MKNKILLIHDDPKFGKNLSDYFKKNKLVLFHSFTLSDGVEMSRHLRPGLILFDSLSIGIDFMEGYQQLKFETNTPIIMLSARNQQVEKSCNQLIKPDEYLHNPFEPRDLLIKTRKILNYDRSQIVDHDQNNHHKLLFPNLEIDKDSNAVKVLNKNLELTKVEFQLLYFLASNPLKTFTRSEILNTVKTDKIKLISISLEIVIYNLKRKLMPLDCIKTVWGSGYSFVPNYESH